MNKYVSIDYKKQHPEIAIKTSIPITQTFVIRESNQSPIDYVVMVAIPPTNEAIILSSSNCCQSGGNGKTVNRDT